MVKREFPDHRADAVAKAPLKVSPLSVEKHGTNTRHRHNPRNLRSDLFAGLLLELTLQATTKFITFSLYHEKKMRGKKNTSKVYFLTTHPFL